MVCSEGEERVTRTCSIRSWRTTYTTKKDGDLETAESPRDDVIIVTARGVGVFAKKCQGGRTGDAEGVIAMPGPRLLQEAQRNTFRFPLRYV